VPPTLVPAVDGGENALGIGGPDERLGLGIVLSDVAVDRRLEVHNRAEHPAPQPPLRERCKVCLVVFGRDEAGRPRASWFDAQSADLAIKAAELMQMRVLRVETEEQKALARQLARGRVSATGRPLRPLPVRTSIASWSNWPGAQPASPPCKRAPRTPLRRTGPRTYR
jgi:hypothetical protein